MRFSVISSGSKANCTFLEAAGTRILIDCGLSAKQTELRLARIGVNPDTIDAVIVTHEHSDHIRGLSVFTRRYEIPVFANKGTAKHIKRVHGIERITTSEVFWVGALKIFPFSINHDASDPVGFTVNAEGLKFANVTDLGRVTPAVQDALALTNALVLESNHDQELLETCSYPWELKRRIASTHGHLSNDRAATLAADLMHPELLHVVLGHLSENSNTPEVAMRTFQRHVNVSRLATCMCACVQQETDLIEVGELERVANL